MRKKEKTDFEILKDFNEAQNRVARIMIENLTRVFNTMADRLENSMEIDASELNIEEMRK